MNLFFSKNIGGEVILLDSEQSRHLASVLRCRVGDAVMVTDGSGVMCWGEVLAADVKAAAINVARRENEYEKRPYRLVLGVAPTKNIDRYEWFLEKATEIGIDVVVPILCKHSERKVVRKDRCEKIIVSAVKQSMKAYMPQVSEMVPFEQFLKSLPDGGGRFIAHCDDADEKVELNDVVDFGGYNVVLIGPEGDFSDEEVTMSKKYGFKSVGLGTARLRTETAALYAVTLFAIKNL